MGKVSSNREPSSPHPSDQFGPMKCAPGRRNRYYKRTLMIPAPPSLSLPTTPPPPQFWHEEEQCFYKDPDDTCYPSPPSVLARGGAVLLHGRDALGVRDTGAAGGARGDGAALLCAALLAPDSMQHRDFPHRLGRCQVAGEGGGRVAGAAGVAPPSSGAYLVHADLNVRNGSSGPCIGFPRTVLKLFFKRNKSFDMRRLGVP